MKMKCPEDIVSYGVICEKFPDPQVRFDTYDLALKWAKMEQPANRPHYIVKCVQKLILQKKKVLNVPLMAQLEKI